LRSSVREHIQCGHCHPLQAHAGDGISNGFIEVVHAEKVEELIFSSEQAGNIAMAFNGIREKKGVSSTVFIGTPDMH
jgi:hypothetical protein